MLPHSLTNFEIPKCYQNEPRFNGVYSRDKIKDGAYIINLNEYSDIGTHWVALYVSNNDVTYFDSFGVEDIIENKDLEGTVLGIFEKLDVVVDPSNVEDCHWIKPSIFR